MTKINKQPEGSFPVICAWCGSVCNYSTIMGSHGICRLCQAKAEKEIEEQLILREPESRKLALKNQGVQ